jgi:multidrug efflux pump subunit AcrA (membrane-fusion protein)
MTIVGNSEIERGSNSSWQLFNLLTKLTLAFLCCCMLNSHVTGQVFTSATATQKPTNVLSNCPVFAIDAIELPAQETGVLTSFDLAAGDEVQAKQTIAKIDSTDVLMEEAVAMSNAVLAKELANDTTDEAFAESVLREAKIALENYKEIDRRGAASDTELRTKQLAVEQAELKLQHAKLARKQLMVKADLSYKSLDAIRQRLKKFDLIVPFDGQLTKISKRAGEWVQAGESITSLVRLNELRVDAFVPIAGQHPSTLIGRNVWISLPNLDNKDQTNRFNGQITHFDPEVTSTGTVRIHATVRNTKTDNYWQLLPGMLVNMQILEQAK